MSYRPRPQAQALPNILTVDVEDWYTSSLDLFPDSDVSHGSKPDESVVENTRRVLEMLEHYGHTATFFVLGTVAEHYPQVVQEIADRGHEVASHGYGHYLLYNLTPEEFREDVRKSVMFLCQAGVETVRGYRAAYWSITKRSLWALNVLAEEGFQYDSSIFPIRRGLYGIPHAPTATYRVNWDGGDGIVEIPPTTWPILGQNLPIAGGGYLRLMPYGIIVRLIRKMNSKGLPAVMYMHPYELDPADIKTLHTVRSGKSWLSLLLQRMNRSTSPRKIQQLLKDIKFVSIASALEKLEPKHTVHLRTLLG